MKAENKRKNTSFLLIRQFLRGSLHLFAICILASFCTTLFSMVIPKIISATVDNVLGSEPVSSKAVAAVIDYFGGVEILREKLWIPALLVLFIGLLMAIFKFINEYHNSKGAERLTQTMRNDLYEKINRLPYSWHVANKTGDIIQRCTSDTDTVRRFIAEQLTHLLKIVILIVLSLVFLFSVSKPIAIISLCSIPIVLSGSILFYKKVGHHFGECDENEGILSAMAQENLTGVRVVRAFGQEEEERKRFEKQNVKYTGCWISLLKVLSFFWAYNDLISALQTMLIVTVGTVLCVQGKMTSGDFIAAISYSSMLIWPVRHLGRMLSEMSKTSVSINRINYILSADEETDAPDAVDYGMQGDIAFDNVSFAYEDTPVLQNVSFTVPQGSVLGILGGTGSGKSTLALLLTRLYNVAPDCGKITVGGVDISKIKLESVRKNTGIVLQEPFLFSKTLAENIGISKSRCPMDEIRRVSEISCLDSSVADFAKGYDTVVGERGVTLSGGQKQRAAIARTLLTKPPIMIFDDSLSAVDAETDAKIRKSLHENFADSTVILISHRITTLMNADNIIVLDGGRITEQGTHDSLVADGGVYAKVFALQSGEDLMKKYRMKGEKSV